ncbi:methyltransferase domain-containing protein [Prodigiosinella confusarubida]|uniref:Methyltransferase domain-containing protein n=1 Tax=Serratia sp. (strain ATCC 39006) TaxID=104623 RepID=A0A2I5THX8_SERS3|nr:MULTISPECIES: methyltransferase domain-containing protein [Enterobacterales]WJV57256.1 methyltransferase domain-containing protein [Pectobacteriaceae bacterium C111]WJY16065.1 methyltransferase domain-containing protein [Pectobacteriaceae bacterium CE90]AUG99846.1 methyltransferase domain-containing protein [Serratia sp. ATCC 39006]AUH04166.1 methyltransferase domain-containing protein [Serratia sp. ATCC 39006]WJV52901.1 methyltransferase domain-containing protein [Prodigiosinella sp. LS101
MKPAQTSHAIIAPDSWDAIPWGDYYREALDMALVPWWPRLFGFHLLKIGQLSTAIESNDCTIPHQVNVTMNNTSAHVIATPSQLPFVEKSVDACLLAHILEYSSDPHSVLREVDRILINDGWIIISGFNPVSLVGLGKVVPGLRKRQPYCSRMFSQMRIMDWLSLLNYEIVYRASLHVLPWRQQGKGRWDNNLPLLGCINLIVARKRTIPLTLMPTRTPLRKSSLSRPLGVTKSYRS